MAAFTYEWSQLDESTFFRRSELYAMEWLGEMDLTRSLVSVAPFAGHIAVIPLHTGSGAATSAGNQSTPIATVAPSGGLSGPGHKRRVYIFSPNGALKTPITLSASDSSIPLATMSWTTDEELVLIYRNATVDFYSIWGHLHASHTLDQELKTLNIEESRLFHHRTSKSVASTDTSKSGSNSGKMGLIGGVFLAGGPSWSFYLIPNLREPKSRKLAPVPGLTAPPTAWTVIPGRAAAGGVKAGTNSSASNTNSKSTSPVGKSTGKENKNQSSQSATNSNHETRVLVARGQDLYLLSGRDKSCTQLVHLNLTASVQEMAVSWDGDRIALYMESGHLWIGLTDDNLSTKLSEFDLKWNTPHLDGLLWCSDKAVAVHWKSEVNLISADGGRTATTTTNGSSRSRTVSPNNSSPSSGPGRSLPFPVESHTVLSAECDSVRLISHDSHETISLVPSVVVDIFRIGSNEAGALLLEAAREYDRSSHKADDYLKVLRDRGEMSHAVSCCILAAGHEPRASTQKALLRAASFGKSFLGGVACDPAPFVTMCQTLRVLNAVRILPVAIPISYAQLDRLTMPQLIDRLIARRRFGLAMEVCKYLNVPADRGASRVLVQWAEFRISQAHFSDEKIAADIIQRLGNSPVVSYAEVANRAIEAGRPALAVRLLDRELSARLQVPMLVKLKEHRQALQKAIESGDTDLIGHVVSHMRSTGNPAEFLITLRQYPIAYALHLKWARHEDVARARDLYYQEDDFMGEASCWIAAACRPTAAPSSGGGGLRAATAAAILEHRISSLQSARDAFKRAQRSGSHPESNLYVTATEEQIKLLNYQAKLEDKFHHTYSGLSLQATMRSLMEDKEFRLADEMRKEFKVPERRYWWLKVGTLADQGNFIELERLSKSTRSGPPIGYEPFVEACLRVNNRFEAAKYLDRCREENRVRLACRAGAHELAAKWANESRDRSALEWVRSQLTPGQRPLADSIAAMISQLGGR